VPFLSPWRRGLTLGAGISGTNQDGYVDTTGWAD
jgi:hypothetical protein